MSVQQMLTELMKAGYSQKEIADQCKTTQPTISRALSGAEPRYETGKSIEVLYCKAKKRAARSCA